MIIITFARTPIIARKKQMLLNGIQQWKNNYIDDYVDNLVWDKNECRKCGKIALADAHLCEDCNK